MSTIKCMPQSVCLTMCYLCICQDSLGVTKPGQVIKTEDTSQICAVVISFAAEKRLKENQTGQAVPVTFAVGHYFWAVLALKLKLSIKSRLRTIFVPGCLASPKSQTFAWNGYRV